MCMGESHLYDEDELIIVVSSRLDHDFNFTGTFFSALATPQFSNSIQCVKGFH